MPPSDIKKKKTGLETESIIIQSSQAIAAACSALPALLNTNITSKPDTEEEKDMVAVLLHGLKRVPVQQKTRCLIKLLETLESFQQN